MSTLNFDANTVEPNSFEVLPAAKYIAVITDSERKATKANTGFYLKLTFEIIEGEFKGRKVFAQLNLENQNADAVRIARGELSAICRAVNIMTPKDSVEIHNLPLEITVVCKKQPDDEIRNEIKGYASKQKKAADKPEQPGNDVPPWHRK
ncbi:MAG: DUF669 domain-containing protein [Lentisphaerota bacterium]